jgi:predicted nucleotide-binding protein
MDSRISQVEALLAEGKAFTFENFSDKEPHEAFGGQDTPEWHTWLKRSYNLVKQATRSDSAASSLASESNTVSTEGNGEESFEYAKKAMLEALRLTKSAMKEDVYGELADEKASNKSAKLSSKVFVVHGHDELLKTEIENFLRAHGLDPIVLHRQPDQGKTLIEKFEHHSDVGYAFVLLTPDDIAYPADQDALQDSKRKKERRARQNVILELGYFVGKLTRSRVCCLRKGDLIIPGDLGGLVYKDVSAGLDAKAYEILKELKTAGYKVTFDA